MAARLDKGDIPGMEARLAALAGREAELRARMAPLERAVARVASERASLRDAMAQARVAAMGGEPDWAWLLVEDGTAASSRAWDAAVRGLGLWPSGYYPETGQRAAKLMMTKTQFGLEEILSGLDEVSSPGIRP